MSAQIHAQIKNPSSQAPSYMPANKGFVQRKCADDECRKKKLMLQRYSTDNAEPTSIPPIVHEVLRSPGQPLDPATRAFMEPRFGHDFSRVRVHTDAKAAESARAVNALAYTLGNNIVFGAGQHAMRTMSGRRLLAHELAHVGQQAIPFLADSSLIIKNSSAAEREADHASEKVLSGQIMGFYTQYPGAGLQKSPAPTSPSVANMSLEEAVKNLPKLPEDQALVVLKRFQNFIFNRISSGEGMIRDLMSQRAEGFFSYLIGGAIESLGFTSLPPENWEEPLRQVNAAYSTIGKRQVKESLDNLLSATEATNRYWGQLNEYLEQTGKGADRSIFTLQVLQAAGAVAATALTGGGATAIAVGAGYGAAQNLAGQATAVSIGIQNKIDWGGMAFDTIFGLLTGALGGKLGNVVLKKLMQNKAIAKLGRGVLSEMVSDLISGRLSSILQTSARSLFDHIRGREELTMEQFIERLAEQLMDPKGMFMDAIVGRTSKIAQAASSKSSKRKSTASEAPTVGSLTKTATPAAEPAHPTSMPETLSPVKADSPKPAAIKPVVYEPTLAKPTELVKTLEPLSHKSTTEKSAAVEKIGSMKAVPADIDAMVEKGIQEYQEGAPQVKIQELSEPKNSHEFPAPDSAKSGLGESPSASAIKWPKDQADIGIGAGLTRSQIKAAGKFMGKPLTSGDNVLGRLWERVSKSGEKSNLKKSNSRSSFDNQRRRFWRAVFDDSAARAVFEKAGCKFGKRGNAPVLELPNGERMQMTIDHITELQTDPSKALDASNLQISPRLENTVMLRQLHEQDPFQNPQRHGGTPN